MNYVITARRLVQSIVIAAMFATTLGAAPVAVAKDGASIAKPAPEQRPRCTRYC